MSTEPCLATVVIPVFNSAATLRRAAFSALRQEVTSLEVLIVDDASRDGSLTTAREIARRDGRARVMALPENRGKSHAMNQAIAAARGTWIAVLDADDRFADDRLPTLIATAEQHRVDLIADNQYLVDSAAGAVSGTALPTDRADAPLTRRDFISGSDALARFNLGMLKPVIRADFIRRTGLRYRESARLSEDFLYLVEFFAAGGSALLVSRPLYHWTEAFGSLSRQWTDTGAGPWRYDFLAALTANADVRDALRPDADADLIALLDRRERAFRRLHWLSELSRSRREHRGLARSLLLIARHPSVWPLLARRVGSRSRRVSHAVDGAVT